MSFERVTRPFVSFVLLVFLVLMTAPPSEAQTARVGRWQFAFAGPKGVQLAFDGVPVIRQSTLNVVKPGWTGSLYSQPATTHRIQTRAEGDGKVVTVEGGNDLFAARYEVTLRPDHTATVAFTYQLLQDVPAELEYGAGYFNANLIACRRYTAQTAAGTREGMVPFLPATPDQKANDLAPGWRSVTFDSRLGKLSLRVRSDEPGVVFFDSRRDPQPWAQDAPVFWMGLGSPPRPLLPRREQRFVLDLAITPDEPEGSSQVSTQRHGGTEEQKPLSPRVESVSDAVDPRGRASRIIPRPKQVRYSSEACRLTPGFQIVAFGPPEGRLAAEALKRELEARWNLSLPVELKGRTGPGTTLLVQATKRSVSPPSPADPRAWQSSPEGYRLECRGRGVRIDAGTPAGAFYGVQTLAQLLRHGRKGGVEVAGARIMDWPSMPFRGAHLFPSGADPGFTTGLVDRILGRYKMNRLVLEVENARWKSHPELHNPQGATPEQLAALAAHCRDRFIEVIPLVQSLGHSQWLFANGQNRELAEDPEEPYAYCPSNPRSYEVLFDVYQEAIDLFKPRLFHIGHDEITNKGRFPHDPVCSAKGLNRLFAEDVGKLTEFLRARGIRPMLWGDMLLHASEASDAGNAPTPEAARELRSLMPKEAIVADWHYAGVTEFPSLARFRSAGLDVVAASWWNPLNVAYLAGTAQKAGALGLLQTTWVGRYPTEKVLTNEARQFVAMVVAAEYAWSGRADLPEEWEYTPGEEFARAWSGAPVDDAVRSGALMSLERLAALPTSAAGGEAWMGLGPKHDLSALSGGRVRLSDVLFDVPKGRAASLGSRLTAVGPDALEVGLGQRAAEVALLNAMGWRVPLGMPVARMTATYSDGETQEFSLVAGRNTAAWTYNGTAAEAPVAWRSRTRAGHPVSLRLTRWRNPRPEVALRSLRFEALDREAAWSLFGLTLIDGPKVK